MPRRSSRLNDSRGMNTRRAEARVAPAAAFTGRLYIDPARIPPGVTYAWKRATARNQPDPDNMRLSLQKGWRPVPVDRHPEWSPPDMRAIFGDAYNAPTVIMNGGLVLCERNTSDIRRERETMADENLRRISSVSWANSAAQEDNLMPMQDFGSHTTIEQVSESIKPD